MNSPQVIGCRTVDAGLRHTLRGRKGFELGAGPQVEEPGAIRRQRLALDGELSLKRIW